MIPPSTSPEDVITFVLFLIPFLFYANAALHNWRMAYAPGPLHGRRGS